jgi:hypothetical protein
VNRSPLQTGVSHLATGSYGGFIYTLDGYESPLNDLPSTQKYSTLTDTWTSVHRIPTARAKGPSGAGMAAVAATAGSRIFVIGGTAGKTTSQKTVEVYSPGTDSWETKKSLPIATGDAFVGVVADKSLANMTIIVGGGGNSSSLSDILAHVHRYDANSDDWITGMPFPSEFSRLGGTITRTCFAVNAMPVGVLSASASPAVHGMLLYVGGGLDADPFSPQNGLKSTWLYTPFVDTWTTGAWHLDRGLRVGIAREIKGTAASCGFWAGSDMPTSRSKGCMAACGYDLYHSGSIGSMQPASSGGLEVLRLSAPPTAPRYLPPLRSIPLRCAALASAPPSSSPSPPLPSCTGCFAQPKSGRDTVAGTWYASPASPPPHYTRGVCCSYGHMPPGEPGVL